MSIFHAPLPFRLREEAAGDLFIHINQKRLANQQAPMIMSGTSNITSFDGSMANHTIQALATGAVQLLQETLPPHSNHPDFLHLAGLVCEAVLEVVFVALPGFIVAYTGMFDKDSQKFLANLNTMVFTPCLIFIKIASQLNAEKLADLGIIPLIFFVQTFVSWLSAQVMSRVFGFGKKRRQKNFIMAMAVFGNSNSLPISLVISLAKTIAGLHWDKIPGDNDEEVAARGILYLLIFQQLGQIVRWTWGYNVLLKPKSEYDKDELAAETERDRVTEEGRYRDEPDSDEVDGSTQFRKHHLDIGLGSASQSSFSSASSTTSDDDDNDRLDGPLVPATTAIVNGMPSEGHHEHHTPPPSSSTPGALNDRSRSAGHITTFPTFARGSSQDSQRDSSQWKTYYLRTKTYLLHVCQRISSGSSAVSNNIFHRFPQPMQKMLSFIAYWNRRFWHGVWQQMNPPLWAMLAALIVASVPTLQHLFFDKGTLINNSVTRAVQQSGGVAVPLILVVLGANLARSTLPKNQLANTAEEKREERNILWAAILSRMVLPTVIMAPLLALTAKYVPVSILDDPIFIIVCFLLTGAPSALQLAQICQINEVFMGVMSSLLVYSYVVAIFPSTLVLVMLALEVLEWAV